MSERLRLGVIGLGRAFTLMLPTFVADPRVALVAASDLPFNADFENGFADDHETLAEARRGPSSGRT